MAGRVLSVILYKRTKRPQASGYAYTSAVPRCSGGTNQYIATVESDSHRQRKDLHHPYFLNVMCCKGPPCCASTNTPIQIYSTGSVILPALEHFNRRRRCFNIVNLINSGKKTSTLTFARNVVDDAVHPLHLVRNARRDLAHDCWRKIKPNNAKWKISMKPKNVGLKTHQSAVMKSDV